MSRIYENLVLGGNARNDGGRMIRINQIGGMVLLTCNKISVNYFLSPLIWGLMG